MTGRGFIERHGLWTDEQHRRGRDLPAEVRARGLGLVRLAWADPHGAARAKAVSPDTFGAALADGYNINVATSTLDASGGRVFSSFTRGGGMELEEMTGSPNLVIVPDPETFRVLPWAPGVGWVLCDEYFRDGTPFHFSSRHLLRRQVERLRSAGFGLRIGIEVEWYLARVIQEHLDAENTGVPGRRGVPVRTAPLEPGYSYHSETNLDLMQPMFSELARCYGELGLGLRSLENEYGPGQVEATFTARDALGATDDYVLFRTATRQVCRRHGHFATFMAWPALANHFPSGWHLHQSLSGAEDAHNRFASGDGAGLSAVGQAWLAGLLEHAVAGTVFACPTVNGFRRFRPNSLAPDRVTWGTDHRGALMRVIDGAGARIENRAGEPSANPYLFIAGQIIAGLDGLERGLEPPPPDDAPYESGRPVLPADLDAALAALEDGGLFRAAMGDRFIDYYLRLKRAELDRFHAASAERGRDGGGEVTEWEQNEYYDFF